MAANNFVGTTNSNWSISTNWSLGSVPTASDGNIATFTSSSPACTVHVASVCNAVDFTNYTHTITFTGTLAVSGSITLGTGMTFAGAAQFSMTNAGVCTLTTNGKIMGIPFAIVGVATVTLADNLNLGGAFSVSASTGTSLLGNNIITNSFGVTLSSSTSGSTSVLNLTGTTTLSASTTVYIPLLINSTGTVTIGGFTYSGSKITYTAGTIAGTSTTSSAITFGAAVTLDLSSTNANILPFNISMNGQTLTLLSNAYISGTITLNGTINGFNWYQYGNSTMSSAIAGTATLIFSGVSSSSTLTLSSTINSNILEINTTFNTPGTIVLSGIIGIGKPSSPNTITYTAGTINAGTSTLYVNTGYSIIFNTTGAKFYNLTLASNNVITINSMLNIAGTLTLTGTNTGFTFNGTAGFNINSMIYSLTSGTTSIIFQSSITYVVYGNLGLNILGGIVSLKASTPGTQAIFNLSIGATQTNTFLGVTDINSNGGQTIWVWSPTTLSNTINWNSLTYLNMQNNKTYIN